MATKTTVRKAHGFRLGLAVLFSSTVAFGLLGGVWAKRPNRAPTNSGTWYDKDSATNFPRIAPAESKTSESFTQNQTPSPSPAQPSRIASLPPDNFPTQTSAAETTSGNQVYINFDNVPSGTLIRDQYPPAVFSTDNNHFTFANGQYYYGSSRPNVLDRGPVTIFDNSGFAPVYVDFTTPVNDLKFYVVAVDEYRQGIAQVNVFRNHTLAGSIRVDGLGIFNIPLVNVGEKYDNVTRIEIVNQNDYRGLAFDDFSFTIAPPASPTPTPTPPQPSTPTGLTATASDQQVSLHWELAGGAEGYYVKRSSSNETSKTIAAVSAAMITTSPIVVPAPVTSYLDTGLRGGTTYTYVVSAFNSAGESPNSSPVSASVPSACGDQAMNGPRLRHVPRSFGGWELDAEVTDNDGVAVRDVTLNGRYMAKSISIPYYRISTSTTGGVKRGELKPNSNDAILRSRLVEFEAIDIGFELVVYAHYIVDRISLNSGSCLHVYQMFTFLPQGLSQLQRPCEPSGTLPCAQFSPIVFYEFESRHGETLNSFNVVQRDQFWVNGWAANSIGTFRDCDSLAESDCHVEHQGGLDFSAFKYKQNPLTTEFAVRVIGAGLDNRELDNIHQTDGLKIREPGIRPSPSSSYYLFSGGCPECVHMHWRWGAGLGPLAELYGNGSINLYGNPSWQDLDIAIVKYNPQEQENTEPLDYTSLVNNESIRYPYETGDAPGRVLVYYSATSRRTYYTGDKGDAFFWHLNFFNPDFGAGTKPTQRNPSATSGNSVTAVQDGPISVTFPHIYQDGSVSFDEFNPNVVAPLPQGYVAYNGVGYNITTDAEVSGPYVVSFGAPSATDQSVFTSLRILHAEPDPLDPESGIWVDRTVLAPDVQAPDFSAKLVNAKVNNLAGFVIARLVQPQPPNTATADLVVSTSSAPDPVVAPNNITYSVTVNNAGPATTTGTGLINSLSSDVEFVSASPSQGTCKFVEGSIYCKLGSLNNGASAVVTLIAKPVEGGKRFAEEGRSILNTAFVMANENDPNKDNNTFVNSNMALRDPNAPPTISIASPASGARYVGPLNITVSANASDTDGTITQVSFYDGETLIGSGTPAGSNQYNLAWNNISFGNHSLVAVATDNGGRKNAAIPVNILVNGTATVNIISPSTGGVIAPHSNMVISANASIPSGVINKVDFFANSALLGTVNSGGQVGINWNDVPNGKYSLTAVVTDGSGVPTTSMPVSVVVSNTPTINITTPQDGSSFGASAVLTITGNVQDDDSIIDRVTFYANGTPLGTGLRSGLNQFTFTWRAAPDGIYSLTASTADQYGLTKTSSAISIGVNTPSPRAGEFVWFDDALPQGATKHADGDVDWYWVDANPGSFSGTKAHQSRNFAQLDLPNISFHQHYFDGATMTLPVNAGDKLFTYVFLDINNMPREIMLQWKDASNWEHRAYWGANRIDQGVDGTNSRRYMGPLPKAGTWVRLEVPASAVGLESATLNGMKFSLDAGRATWDLAGKATANATQPPTTPPGDSVWIEDGFPAGAVTDVVNDIWNWVAAPVNSGQTAHQSYFRNNDDKQYRSHSFTGAQTPMQVNPGDVLFSYVYLGDPDPNHQPFTPDQIMLQWYDGSSWEHRAFWGENYIGQQIPSIGVQGTESQRYMGGLPAGRGWYRLEVPASYVGLEGNSVSGMAFSVFRNGKNPFVTWDRSGKSSQLTGVPLPLSATTGVWRLFSNTHGYAFETNDQGPPEHLPQKKDVFYVHPNQAAGTVPFYRFRRPTNYEYFYSRCKECYDGLRWQFEGIAFYVYADGSTPGTVPLYLYHDNQFHYSLTTDLNEVSGENAIWAYVYPNNTNVPVCPRLNLIGGQGSCNLYWFDNPLNVTGFKIERQLEGEAAWTQIATVGSEVTSYNACMSGSTQQGATQQESRTTSPVTRYRMRATSLFGDSAYSNEVASCPGPICTDGGGLSNSPPDLSIVSPANGDVVDHNFAITANAFDLDGAGTIVKVEFFANGSKLGEVTSAPYVFAWNNVASGTYSLTATVTDVAGAATTSSSVSVTVNGAPSVNITSPASGAVLNAPASVTINASASDSDGSISKVEFFQGSIKLGEDTSAPFSFDWTSVPTGNYSLTARATDAGGAVTTSAPVNVTVSKSNQTITVDPIAEKSYGDAPFTINAAASSGLPVSFTIISAPATISGNTLTITGAGSVTVRASQGGDANYNAATDVDRTFNIAKASATITLSNLNQTYDGTPKAATATTNPAGLSGVSFTYGGSSTVPANAGSYAVVAALANDNYEATNANATLTIAKAAQTITFNALADKTYGDAPFAVSGSSSSGLPVSFSIASGPATVSGSTVTITGAGTVTVRASQAGNSNFNAATDVDRSFNVAKASATITLSNLNQTYDGTPKAATATTNPAGLSGVSITYDAATTAPTNAGSYAVVASLANDNYTTGIATGTLVIPKATQTITFNVLVDKTYGAAPFTVSASSSSGLTLSFSIASGPANVSGTTVTITGAGTVTVRASQAGNANYNATADVDQTFNVAKAAATITLSNLGRTYDGTPKTATATTNPTGLSGVAITYNGSATAPTNAGSYSVVVSLTNDDYTASNATGTLVVAKATPTISWSNPSGIVYGTGLSSTQLNATASFGGSSLAGSFVYTPDAGTVLNPGNNQLLSTTFAPTDSTNFNSATSSVGINVNASPGVNITSPTAGAVFTPPASLTISASASDSDGTVSKVEFFQGATLIGTVTASPYNLFWSNIPVGSYFLTAKATDNLGATTVSSNVSITVVQPNNSGKIAFASNRDGSAQIYSMNQDGSGLFRLTSDAANNECPKWSPNNSRIVFQSDRNNVFSGAADIYVMNWDGSGQTRLTSDAYDDGAPVWSPDGTKIAFQSARNGVNYQVYVMNADGSGQVNVSNSTANDTNPSWSPDSTKIAFASDRDRAGFSSIYVMNANGSNQTRLTFSGSGLRDEQPAWSPDGMKLAFTSTRDSIVVTWQETDDEGGILVRTELRPNKEVYVMNADGSAQVRLTNTLENDDSPAWSSDGTKIAFRSDRARDCCDPVAQIWLMNVDGSNQLDLSNNGFGDYCPSWSR